MPPEVNEEPQRKWASELKARMEEVHFAVRYHTGQEMVRRQKQYDGAKVKRQGFATKCMFSIHRGEQATVYKLLERAIHYCRQEV